MGIKPETLHMLNTPPARNCRLTAIFNQDLFLGFWIKLIKLTVSSVKDNI